MGVTGFKKSRLSHDFRKALLSGAAIFMGMVGVARAQEPLLDETTLPALLEASATDYTRALEQIRDQYRPLLEIQNIKPAIFDADRFTALSAPGMLSAAETMQLLSRAQGLPFDDETAQVSGNRMTAQSVHLKFLDTITKMQLSEPDPSAVRVSFADIQILATQKAENALYMEGGTGKCYIIAPSFGLYSMQTESFDPENNAFLGYRHEFWHCMDEENKLEENLRYASPELQGYYRESLARKAETFADIGAIGDMIALDGENLDAIDKLITRRFKEADFKHFSPPSLATFRMTLEDIGLDTFRKMDLEARKDLYRKVADETALRAEELLMLDSAPKSLKDTAAQAKFIASIEAHPGMTRLAEHYESFYTYALYEMIPHSINIVPLDTPDLRAIDAWDAKKALLGKSGAQPTRESVVKARSEILNELRQSAAENPALYPGMAGKLDEAYLRVMRDLNATALAKVPTTPAFSAKIKPPKTF